LLKLVLMIFWIALISMALVFHINHGVPLSEYPQIIQQWIKGYGIWGGVVYVVIYIIRPLVFFPATLLTAVSGLIFGPWWGVVYTVIGENLSANLTFLIGRFFGKEMMDRLSSKYSQFNRLDCAFRDNGFISVFIMRLTHFPFDLVGYLSGACSLRQRDFALGTFIGILPGLITFVLLGASFTDPRNLLLVFISLIIGIVIAKKLKAKNSKFQMKDLPKSKQLRPEEEEQIHNLEDSDVRS